MQDDRLYGYNCRTNLGGDTLPALNNGAGKT